jgi:hypothetical protein
MVHHFKQVLKYFKFIYTLIFVNKKFILNNSVYYGFINYGI